MKAFITTTSFGFIATDEEFNIVDKFLFEEKQVEMLEKIQQNVVITEEVDLIGRLTGVYDEIIIETRLNKNSFAQTDFLDKITVEKFTSHGDYIRKNFDDVINEVCNIDITPVLNSTYNMIAKEKIRESVKTNDVMIVETINSLE